jgi:hypothetical protein
VRVRCESKTGSLSRLQRAPAAGGCRRCGSAACCCVRMNVFSHTAHTADTHTHTHTHPRREDPLAGEGRPQLALQVQQPRWLHPERETPQQSKANTNTYLSPPTNRAWTGCLSAQDSERQTGQPTRRTHTTAARARARALTAHLYSVQQLGPAGGDEVREVGVLEPGHVSVDLLADQFDLEDIVLSDLCRQSEREREMREGQRLRRQSRESTTRLRRAPGCTCCRRAACRRRRQ